MKKRMKRSAAAVLAAGVLLAPAMAAAPVAAAGVAQQGVTAAEAASLNSTRTTAAAGAAEAADVRLLTLEEAITRALEVDSNYKILEYTWRMLDLQLEDLEDQKDELESIIDGRDQNEDDEVLEENGDEHSDSDEISLERIGEMVHKILEQWMTPSTDTLEYQRDQLETAIDKLKSQRTATRLQQQEAREGVKLLITQLYVGLLAMKQQLLLTDATLQQKEQAIQNAFLKYRLGLISMEAHEQEVRQLEEVRRNADSLRIQYEKQLAQLLFLLDLPQDRKYELVPVSPDPEQSVQMPENVDELVANSFKVRQAREALRQARYDYSLAEDYEDEQIGGETPYTENKVSMLRYQVRIAEEQLKQTEKNVRAQIDGLYRSAADAQAAYEQAQKKWRDATTDYQRMVLRYELGLIARQDLENMNLAVRQAQVQLEMAKYQYFL
ncbi:MAG: TolC family protein, partial [Bacillota bacterium]